MAVIASSGTSRSLRKTLCVFCVFLLGFLFSLPVQQMQLFDNGLLALGAFDDHTEKVCCSGLRFWSQRWTLKHRANEEFLTAKVSRPAPTANQCPGCCVKDFPAIEMKVSTTVYTEACVCGKAANRAHDFLPLHQHDIHVRTGFLDIFRALLLSVLSRLVVLCPVVSDQITWRHRIFADV